MEKIDENDGFSAPSVQEQLSKTKRQKNRTKNNSSKIICNPNIPILAHMPPLANMPPMFATPNLCYPFYPYFMNGQYMNMMMQMNANMQGSQASPLNKTSPPFIPVNMNQARVVYPCDDTAVTSDSSNNKTEEDSVQDILDSNSLGTYAIKNDPVDAKKSINRNNVNNVNNNDYNNKVGDFNRNLHSGYSCKQSEFYCKKHRKFYDSKSAFEHHLKSSHNSFKCTVCDKIFKQKNALSQHMKLHVFQCQICNKKFPTEKGLSSHLNTHNYECSICNKLFDNNDLLFEHLKIHPVQSNKTYVNHGGVFNNNTIVEKKDDSYYKQDLYYCNNCEKAFEKKSQLDQHQKDKHYVPCTDCGKTFINATAMKAHYNSVHKNVKNESSFICKIDKKKFATASALEMHQNVKHKYYCSLHRKSFASEDALNAHWKVKHPEENINQ